MHRLFAGLRPQREIRERLLAAMAGVPGARWQDDAQLHITLRYIGEVDGDRAEDVAAALGAIRAPALTLRVAGTGCFDRRGRIDTLWAGIRPHEEITRLHRKIDTALVRIGLEPERRAYMPHVTLARLNAPEEAVRPFLAAHADLASADFRLDHFLLYESHLGRERATYEPVARYALD